ncbi:MAG: signal recognition particle-docking protein FtsY [Betaproteobacteria bacterium]|nr:signal recognition particle-docking protein FtsY [Betaproteobacteria bacterium]
MLSFLKSGQKSGTSWGARLKAGLARTRKVLNTDIVDLFSGGPIDETFFDELESTLLLADVGVAATAHLIAELRSAIRRNALRERHELKRTLRDAMVELLKPIAVPLDVNTHKPFIIMLAGVNGAGKTTSIGKLAKYYQAQGKSILLAAGDTFRAAAREQLQEWGDRNNVAVIAQQSGDAAAVIFDAITAAKARNIDIVLCDTAGRLPTQLHLMEEISKVKRVIAKAAPGAPHEVLLVLDANTGQNALNQVKTFNDALGVTGLVLTKLDGTAKGGVIAAIARAHQIPVRFIGVGEAIDDLQPFAAEEFVDALLG